MTSFTQDPATKLLGSPDAIKELSEKDSANILIISDSHGAAANLRLAVMENGRSCDALVFCGDGISDIAALTEHALREPGLASCVPPVTAFVQGNNDFDIYPFVNPLYGTDEGQDYYVNARVPMEQSITVCGHRIYITHGHRYSLYGGTKHLESEAMKRGAQIALYGHTHIARIVNQTGMYILNPGSISRPRGGQPPSFARLSLRKGDPNFSGIIYELKAGGSAPYVPKPDFYW